MTVTILRLVAVFVCFGRGCLGVFLWSGPLFTIWDTFLGRIVSHFDNNLVFVILEHEIGDFRVPFREQGDSEVRRGVKKGGSRR